MAGYRLKLQKCAELIHVSGLNYLISPLDDTGETFLLMIADGVTSNLDSQNAGTELCFSRNGDQAVSYHFLFLSRFLVDS